MEPDSSDSSRRSQDNHSEYVAIARLGRSFGLNGWCRIYAFGTTLGKVKVPYRVMAGIKNPEVTVFLNELKSDAKGYKGRFKGYETKDDVEVLKNYQLFIEINKLPKTRENEFYHFELEEMSVFLIKKKERLGKVVHVHNYPTVDALEVGKNDGSTLLIPMRENIIEKIDKDNLKIFVFDAAIEELL